MNLSPSTFIILYLVLFLAGAMIGYVIEILFRRFFSAKKWVNPGFLAGPWLPLYGFGLVVMLSFSLLFTNALPKDLILYNPIGNFEGRPVAGPTVGDLIPISAMGASLILLEFVAGVIFVKGFKVRLWDYTNMKGNILGVICPVFNVIWFAIAIIYYYGLSPFIYEAAKASANYLFGDASTQQVAHFGLLFIIGIVYGIFVVDLVVSLRLFASIQSFARTSGIAERYERLKAKQKELSSKSAAALYNSLPEAVKDRLAKMEGKKGEKKPSRFKAWFDNLVLIDPSKTDASGNYDESGRPIKEDDVPKD